ncbi:MAG: hypothetical protein NVS4B5_04100 [Vulcanimicrobiaceae bacterium]
MTTRGAEQERALDGEESDGAAAPDGDDVAGLDLAIFSGLVTRGQDIGEEEYLLVRQCGRDLEEIRVGKDDARAFGLAAGITAERMRVAVQTGRRVSGDEIADLGVGIGIIA